MRFIPAYAGNSEGQSIRAGSETVHPRLRGELLPRTSRTKNAFGSSPLTRGTHAQDLTACFNQRFIPAYAGNSGESKMGWWADSVHPRLRGELTDELYSAVRRTGSSPLTRGTQQETFGARQRPRFIPAYAGNSNSLISFEVNMTVHPRLRGELCLSGSESIRSTGSSPLTRGTLSSELYTIVKTRFIPAYAGNSLIRMMQY